MTTLKARLRQGQAITMIGNSLPDTYAAEMVASAGFDAVMIDLQHSAIGLHRSQRSGARGARSRDARRWCAWRPMIRRRSPRCSMAAWMPWWRP